MPQLVRVTGPEPEVEAWGDGEPDEQAATSRAAALSAARVRWGFRETRDVGTTILSLARAFSRGRGIPTGDGRSSGFGFPVPRTFPDDPVQWRTWRQRRYRCASAPDSHRIPLSASSGSLTPTSAVPPGGAPSRPDGFDGERGRCGGGASRAGPIAETIEKAIERVGALQRHLRHRVPMYGQCSVGGLALSASPSAHGQGIR